MNSSGPMLFNRSCNKCTAGVMDSRTSKGREGGRERERERETERDREREREREREGGREREGARGEMATHQFNVCQLLS